MRALLDINVVIALLDSGHVMHRAATVWMERQLEHGWATTPITQNGVIRIMSQPAYPNHRPAAQVAERLAEACGHPTHLFWAEDISLLETGLIHWDRLLSPRQFTDGYLLALAAKTAWYVAIFVRRALMPRGPSPEGLASSTTRSGQRGAKRRCCSGDRTVASTLHLLWLSLGQEGDAFQQELAAFLGLRHSLLVNSGSSAAGSGGAGLLASS